MLRNMSLGGKLLRLRDDRNAAIEMLQLYKFAISCRCQQALTTSRIIGILSLIGCSRRTTAATTLATLFYVFCFTLYCHGCTNKKYIYIYLAIYLS